MNLGGEKMMEILNYISQFGFPMVVAAYLLTRMEKKLDEIIMLLASKNGQGVE